MKIFLKQISHVYYTFLFFNSHSSSSPYSSLSLNPLLSLLSCPYLAYIITYYFGTFSQSWPFPVLIFPCLPSDIFHISSTYILYPSPPPPSPVPDYKNFCAHYFQPLILPVRTKGSKSLSVSPSHNLYKPNLFLFSPVFNFTCSSEVHSPCFYSYHVHIPNCVTMFFSFFPMVTISAFAVLIHPHLLPGLHSSQLNSLLCHPNQLSNIVVICFHSCVLFTSY